MVLARERGTAGILATRWGPGLFTLELSENVPYGETWETRHTERPHQDGILPGVKEDPAGTDTSTPLTVCSVTGATDPLIEPSETQQPDAVSNAHTARGHGACFFC